MDRYILLFHELTHCYCGRGHDFKKGKKYTEKRLAKVLEAAIFQITGQPQPGYYEDGCPVSVMYPSVLDDECSKRHYQEYVAEMFKRCKPW
jgi:hypothetical protein